MKKLLLLFIFLQLAGCTHQIRMPPEVSGSLEPINSAQVLNNV